MLNIKCNSCGTVSNEFLTVEKKWVEDKYVYDPKTKKLAFKHQASMEEDEFIGWACSECGVEFDEDIVNILDNLM